MRNSFYIFIIIVLSILLIIKSVDFKKKEVGTNKEKMKIEICENEIPKIMKNDIVFNVKEIRYISDSYSIVEVELSNHSNDDKFIKGIKIMLSDKDGKETILENSIEETIPAEGSILIKATSKSNLVNTTKAIFAIIE